MNKQFDKRHWRLGLLLVLLGAVVGCSDTPATQGPASQRQSARRTRGDDLFKYAVANLNRLEEFDTSEMLKQTVDRLNQWVRDQKPPKDWKVDPLVAKLPKEYAELPVMKLLDKRQFDVDKPAADGMALQEAVLLRDVSKWARGDEVDDLQRAKCLFDWTVRNIQLEQETLGPLGKPQRIMQTPWETLLWGRGSAAERAWVFILLARQQGLDAALLVPADQGDSSQGHFSSSLVGVLSNGELYLFDTLLGLPIPAPDGKKLDPSGRLDVEPATLSQVAADNNLLRQLDADLEHPYPLEAAELQRVVALVEGSPSYLSQRMRLLESRLAGDDRLVLTAEPSAQAARLKKCKHVADARLWLRPYQTSLQQSELGPKRVQWQLLMLMPFQINIGSTPALYKGRMYHLKGCFAGSPSAAEYYQMARLSNRQIASAELDPKSRAVYLRAKLDASYWLGLISAYDDNPPSAIDYFTTRTLDVVPDCLWTHGAIYNLARVYEVSGRPQEAIELYRADVEAPGHHGNVLRARWLESLIAKAPPTAP